MLKHALNITRQCTKTSWANQSLSSIHVQNVNIDTDDKTEYMTHMDRHKKFLRFCCGNCKKGFYSQAHLTYHVSRCVEVEKNFECNRCGMKFATEKELRVHFKSAHVDPIKGEKYYCDACICVLVTKKAYNYHCRLDVHRNKVKAMRC